MVKVHYTGKLTNGEVFDSSLEREPLEVQLGQGQLIPGFEKGLVDMEVNEKKTITIPKEEAYGEVQKELFHKIEKEQLLQANNDTIKKAYAMSEEWGKTSSYAPAYYEAA